MNGTSMDLSWNYAAESQAYDRYVQFDLSLNFPRLTSLTLLSCHRIGQDKPVFVKRLVVENTIEER
jgi:hypothetical protein